MKTQGGFSLVELIVVIAIMALLAMLAKPSFMRFLAKAKRSEAYMNLHSIYAAQKAHWAEHGTYSTTLFGKDGIGWKPEGYKGGGEQENFHYTYGYAGSEGQNCFTGKLATDKGRLSSSHAGKDSFLVTAVADIDGDGFFDVLTIDDTNTIRIVNDDLLD